MASTSTGAIAGSVGSVARLPATGSGGVARFSLSLVTLVLLSVIAAAAGGVATLLGRQRELEDDGITAE